MEVSLFTRQCLGKRRIGNIAPCANRLALGTAESTSQRHNSVEVHASPSSTSTSLHNHAVKALVMSKGHAGPALYAALALKGYFSQDELLTLNQAKTRFPSHCDRNMSPGIDMTTGSLGQGMSTAIGVVLGNRLDGRNSYTYLILGDGECDEGQVWEGALFASHRKLSNLIGFVDYNKQQLDGYTRDICNLGNLAGKFAAFDWSVQEVDGADVEQIYAAIQNAKSQHKRPSMIVLNTEKGKGCSFAEHQLYNHHMTFTKQQADEAIAVLEAELNGGAEK